MEKETEPKRAEFFRLYINDFREDSFHENSIWKPGAHEFNFLTSWIPDSISYLVVAMRQALPLRVQMKAQLLDAIVVPAAAI